MENIKAEKYYTRIDNDGVGHLMIETEGETLEVATIIGASDMDAHTLHDRAVFLLKINEIDIVEPDPTTAPVKPKRKYTKHVNLGLASDFGKVTLSLASPDKSFGYILYLKGTTKFVYRLDSKGIYVIDESKKTKPMIWSEDDIKKIKNIDDFDKKKVEVSKKPKNRLS